MSAETTSNGLSGDVPHESKAHGDGHAPAHDHGHGDDHGNGHGDDQYSSRFLS